MLSRVSERKMLSARALLLLAWLVLIASLFWDPYSAALTEMENAVSPFRITDETVHVQDHVLTTTPYPLSARIFWTVLVPILPLFLMVFGHEAWRRICPLSFASQIPGYLGLRRYRTRLDRRTGLVKRTIALLDRQGWLSRNSWYVQFGLLFTGVNTRLLIINTDREAMGIALLTVIGAAMLTGLLWGGKTWCNYLCPANVVQKIYTEPRGILESEPHFSRPALPQSVCRKPSPKGDISACVACTANCGDIDLQRSYWNGILDPQRRHVYYMFFGLILGFYWYYYLYAGNWDYYFSGIWTHEVGIRQKLLGPGFWIAGQIISIPKILAAPLTLGLACAASLVLGKALEGLYRRLRSAEEDFSDKIIVHHCLCISAWLSINAFYLFGGRPNILFLPPLGARLIDIGIVALTTLWLRRAMRHTPTRYQQESMASGLLDELKKLKVNVSKFLDGRKLESLKAGEIYLLTKVLPEFSQQQKLSAYRKILDETITKGTTASPSSLKVLEDFRSQMSITEDEHTNLLEELGVPDVASIDASAITAEEKAASFNHYRDILNGTVASRLEIGMAIGDVLRDPAFQATVDVLRQSLQITDDEHKIAIEELSSRSGIIGTKLDEAHDALVQKKSLRLCLEAADIADPLGSSLLDLLLDTIDAHEQALALKVLSMLRNVGAERNFQRYAEDLGSLSGHNLEVLLRQTVPSEPTKRWREALHPKIVALLLGEASAEEDDEAALPLQGRTYRNAILGSLDVETNLLELMAFDDPLIRAIGLTIFGFIEPALARSAAEQMLADGSGSEHPLLLEAMKYSLGHAGPENSKAGERNLRAKVQVPGRAEQGMSFQKKLIMIGRAPDNDIAIPHPAAWAYHLAIDARDGAIRAMRLDGGNIFINERQVQEESVSLEKDDVISLDNSGEDTPKIIVKWDKADDTGRALIIHPLLRLAMLARNNKLGRLSLGKLADIAFDSRAERYIRGTKLECAADEGRHFLIHQGQVRLFDPVEMDFLSETVFGSGDLIGPDIVEIGSPVFPEVVSDFAIIVGLPSTPEIEAAALRHQFNRMETRSASAVGIRKAYES